MQCLTVTQIQRREKEITLLDCPTLSLPITQRQVVKKELKLDVKKEVENTRSRLDAGHIFYGRLFVFTSDLGFAFKSFLKDLMV